EGVHSGHPRVFISGMPANTFSYCRNGLNESKGEGSSSLEESLLQASSLVEDGDEAGALRFLLELEQEHARDATLLCMIGVVAEHLGAGGMAVDYFRRCLAEEPTDPAVLV